MEESFGYAKRTFPVDMRIRRSAERERERESVLCVFAREKERVYVCVT